jgi:hypothetical protein
VNTLETTEPIDLYLELTSSRDSHSDVRRQVSDICVSQLGISASETERLLERQGPFTVSAFNRNADLASIINELQTLGVLVRPTSHPHCTRRAALYSSQFPALLSPRHAHVDHTTPLTSTDSRQNMGTRGVLMVISLLLVSLGIPTSQFLMTNTASSSWKTYGPGSTSLNGGAVTLPPLAEQPGTFRGSASHAGLRVDCQVLRSGGAYSARFYGRSVTDALTPIRIEGEPIFLVTEPGKLAGATTYTTTDASGVFRSGSARIQIDTAADGTPHIARIVLDHPRSDGGLRDNSDITITFSIDLLP